MHDGSANLFSLHVGDQSIVYCLPTFSDASCRVWAAPCGAPFYLAASRFIIQLRSNAVKSEIQSIARFSR